MRNFFILTFDNLLNSFRTKRALIFLILYLGVFVLVTFSFIKATEAIEEQVQIEITKSMEEQGMNPLTQKIATSMTTQMAESFARDFLKTKNDQTINFLLETPFLNIMLFLVTLFGTPLLILILKYDTLTQEIYDGTLRFVLFRTSRKNIFFAKFLSGALEFAFLTLIAFLLAYLWTGIAFNQWMKIGIGLRFWFLAQLFLAIFVSFYLFISVIFKKPFYSLLTACLFSLILLLAPLKIRYISPFDTDYLRGFFYPYSSIEFQIMVFGYLSLIVFFLSTGFFIFKKKAL